MKHNGITTDTSSDISGKVVTRIAPSPTGSFHIGTARTALFNFLFARKHNGIFAVRFEDTDRERSDEKHEEEILSALHWLSLHPDTVTRQSERKEIHREYIARLLDSDHAYVSREPSKKDPSREVEVVRFRNTNPKVSFTDTVRSDITIDTSDLGDFVIARSTDDPLYNLAVVIDDAEMGVTHVLRGDDHIVNTPRQVLLIKALGISPPMYTHIPLIHSPSGGKLSKRKDAVSVLSFVEQGYLPEALINTIALLGWNPKDDREIFTLEELIELFSLEHIQKKEAIFDEKKLQWFNKQCIQRMPENRLRGEVVPALVKRFPVRSRLHPRSIQTILQTVRERGIVFSEVRESIHNGEYDFFFTAPDYPAALLLPKDSTKEQYSADQILTSLERTHALLKSVSAYRQWDEKHVQDAVWKYAEEQGKSRVLWPLRVALSGREKSPGPFVIAQAIGKKQTLMRVKKGVVRLRELSGSA